MYFITEIAKVGSYRIICGGLCTAAIVGGIVAAGGGLAYGAASNSGNIRIKSTISNPRKNYQRPTKIMIRTERTPVRRRSGK